jgi:hypothetical protein
MKDYEKCLENKDHAELVGKTYYCTLKRECPFKNIGEVTLGKDKKLSLCEYHNTFGDCF